jgi:16S rRNA (cytidine1402-2'-O)-methyltransferase
LHIVSTPIGNLEDISLRAVRILSEADVIIAEDTRHTGKLLKHFDIPHKPMVSLYEEVEVSKLEDLLALVASDQKIVLVSDAGTPLISDPGFKLVREAVARGVRVESIPGPTALIAALTVSGLPPDKFMYLGYFPEKESHQKELFAKIRQSLELVASTVIFYASPYKLKKNLGALESEFGDIEIVIARELTKIYEEVWKGKVSEALLYFKEPRGEFVVLFHL